MFTNFNLALLLFTIQIYDEKMRPRPFIEPIYSHNQTPFENI